MSCNKSCKDTIILGGNQKNVPAPFCLRCASGRGMRVGRYGAFGPFRSGEGVCGRKRKRGNRDRRQGGQCRCAGAWGRDGDAAGMGMPEGDSLRFRQGCVGANVAAGCLVAATEDVRRAGGVPVRPFIRGWGETAGITRSGSRSARIGTVRPGLQANERAGAARRVQMCAAACVPLTGNRSLRNRRRGSGRTGTGSRPPL